jgi:hypothetical protein
MCLANQNAEDGNSEKYGEDCRPSNPASFYVARRRRYSPDG